MIAPNQQQQSLYKRSQNIPDEKIAQFCADLRSPCFELLEEAATVVESILNGEQSLEVSTKQDGTIVTDLEIRLERALHGLIHRRFPEHGIIGEETASTSRGDQFVKWIIDPIDGSTGFVRNRTECATLIGVTVGSRPHFGFAYDIASGLRLLSDGVETRLNDKVIVMYPNDLTSAKITFADNGLTEIPAELQNSVRRYVDLVHALKHNHSGNVKPYHHPIFSLSQGEVNAHAELWLEPWDILPLDPIVRGMGGTISGIAGGDPVSERSLLIAHRKLHPEVLSCILR